MVVDAGSSDGELEHFSTFGTKFFDDKERKIKAAAADWSSPCKTEKYTATENNNNYRQDIVYKMERDRTHINLFDS